MVEVVTVMDRVEEVYGRGVVRLREKQVRSSYVKGLIISTWNYVYVKQLFPAKF